MGGKKRALQSTYRTGRERRRRSRRLPLSGPLSGVGIFFGLWIRTSSLGDCYRYLDQDLSRDSGLLSGSRSGTPLTGLLSISRSGPLSGLVSGISIRTPLGDSGLVLGSRSGPPIERVGTSFRLSIRTSSLGTCFGISIRSSLETSFEDLDRDFSRDFFPDLDQDLFRDLNRGLGQANRHITRVFFSTKFYHFLEKNKMGIFWNCIFLVQIGLILLKFGKTWPNVLYIKKLKNA
jgi:hypothetical protein